MPPNNIKFSFYIKNLLFQIVRQFFAYIKKPYRSIFLLIIFSIFHSQAALAICTSNSVAIPLPNLEMNLNTIPLNGPIGSEVVTTAQDMFTCTMISSGNRPVLSRSITSTIPSATNTGIKINGRTIYSTSVPGIGYALALEPTNFCSNTIEWIPFSTCTFSASITSMSVKLHLQLYRIGSISSTSNIKLYTESIANIENHSAGTSYTYSNVLFNLFNLKTYTCSLSSASTTSVSLPKVYGNNFVTNGVSAGSTPFSITVNCPSPINLNITFTDNNNPGNSSTVLTPLASSTAKGLGIQLKYNGHIIGFGPDSADPGTTNQLVLNGNLTGSQTFPFTAAYVRTGTVTAGTLAARATFTLSYQ